MTCHQKKTLIPLGTCPEANGCRVLEALCGNRGVQVSRHTTRSKRDQQRNTSRCSTWIVTVRNNGKKERRSSSERIIPQIPHFLDCGLSFLTLTPPAMSMLTAPRARRTRSLFLASGERSCSPGKKIRRSMPSRKASGRSRCDRLHGSGKGKLCKWSIFEIYNTLKF